METRINAGYAIVSNIIVGEHEIVLGHNPKAVNPFVTWEYSPRGGYYWGHYFDTENKATQDLLMRAFSVVADNEKQEPVADIIGVIASEIHSDNENRSRDLISRYIHATYDARRLIDAVLIDVCGWDFSGLVELAGMRDMYVEKGE